MVGIIDGFHNPSIYLAGFCVSIFIAAVFLIVGIWYFRKTIANVCGHYLAATNYLIKSSK